MISGGDATRTCMLTPRSQSVMLLVLVLYMPTDHDVPWCPCSELVLSFVGPGGRGRWVALPTTRWLSPSCSSTVCATVSTTSSCRFEGRITNHFPELGGQQSVSCGEVWTATNTTTPHLLLPLVQVTWSATHPREYHTRFRHENPLENVTQASPLAMVYSDGLLFASP